MCCDRESCDHYYSFHAFGNGATFSASRPFYFISIHDAYRANAYHADAYYLACSMLHCYMNSSNLLMTQLPFLFLDSNIFLKDWTSNFMFFTLVDETNSRCFFSHSFTLFVVNLCGHRLCIPCFVTTTCILYTFFLIEI